MPTLVHMRRCFGFDTAVEEAQRALLAAKVEASSARKGIGLVKLMGRQSGFIAMQASMASGVSAIFCVLHNFQAIICHHHFFITSPVVIPPKVTCITLRVRVGPKVG